MGGKVNKRNYFNYKLIFSLNLSALLESYVYFYSTGLLRRSNPQFLFQVFLWTEFLILLFRKSLLPFFWEVVGNTRDKMLSYEYFAYFIIFMNI